MSGDFFWGFGGLMKALERFGISRCSNRKVFSASGSSTSIDYEDGDDDLLRDISGSSLR